MKSILSIFRGIIAISLCYLAYMFFSRNQFSNYILLGLSINLLLDAIDRFISEKKNWFIISFDILLALITVVIFIKIIK